MIRLYGLPLSTYCTKVRIVLRIKGVDFEDLAPPGGHYTSAEYRDNFAPGTIPFLEHDSIRLFDSEAIVEYLEEVFPDPSLLGSDPASRANQRALSGFHTTRVEPRVRALFPLVKQAAGDNACDSINACAQQFQYELDRLDQVIDPQPFLGGQAPCLADCAYPSTIHMGMDILEFLGSPVEMSSQLTNWLVKLDQQPVIGEEVESNRAAIAKWIQSVSA